MPQTQTAQRGCDLYGSCRYPCTHARYFASTKTPCSQGDQCEVEVAVRMPSILFTLDHADQLERNTARGLPWHCGCELCQSEKWIDCYQKHGPNRELRNLIASSGHSSSWHEHTQYLAQQEEQAAKAAEAKAP